MLITFFKTGDSPRSFGFDGVEDLQVSKSGKVTISGTDKVDNSGYMIFVSSAEYSYFTLHKEDNNE